MLGEIASFTKIGREWRIPKDSVVISSNVPVRFDGLPRSGTRQPDDPGVAVYLELDKANEHDEPKPGMLEAKMLTYGKTFPLRVGGQTIALLAPNEEVAERIKARSRHRVLTAAQVKWLARLPENHPLLCELLADTP